MSKTVVITGASKGFGYHLSKEFAKHDYNIVMNSRNSKNLALSRYKIIKDTGIHHSKIISIPKNVEYVDTSSFIVKRTLKHFKTIDIWINNAGTLNYKFDSFVNFDNFEINHILNTNLTGTILGTHAAIIAMNKQNESGVIYNVTGCGSNGEIVPGYSVYSTSKNPIKYFSKTINKELKDTNCCVKTISPGLLMTDLYKSNKYIQNTFVNYFCNEPSIVAEYVFNEIHNKNPNDINYLSLNNKYNIILLLSELFTAACIKLSSNVNNLPSSS
tara:strand:- start:960 stop:1775 length:816 start_codon:yes stop_codon:yes gene_type:complete